MRRTVVLFALLVAGCRRTHAAETSPSASAPAPPPPLPTASSSSSALPRAVPADVLDEPSPYREATRATLATPGYAELLAPVRDLVDGRFAHVPPGEIELQIVSAGGARRAVFVHHHAPGFRPLMFAFDAGALAWTKERPTGGLDPAITELALAPGPNGDVALAFCDPGTGLVAIRRWLSDGGLLADYRVVALDRCDAIASLYWPEKGWLVVPSSHGAAKAQLLGTNGKLLWGPEGRIVAFPWRMRDPASLALDTDDSVMLFFYGPAGSPNGARDRFFAARYDAHGNPAFKTPLDLGEAPAFATGSPRKIDVARSRYGAVHASLYRDAKDGGTAEYEVDVTSDGAVVLRLRVGGFTGRLPRS